MDQNEHGSLSGSLSGSPFSSLQLSSHQTQSDQAHPHPQTSPITSLLKHHPPTSTWVCGLSSAVGFAEAPRKAPGAAATLPATVATSPAGVRAAIRIGTQPREAPGSHGPLSLAPSMSYRRLSATTAAGSVRAPRLPVGPGPVPPGSTAAIAERGRRATARVSLRAIAATTIGPSEFLFLVTR
ncbi:hypothetical protein FZEAL_5420 [Fusarium zealandicum]|uniref:Uncharacterized protein n=1 Tax=Fusarium zealandicum TaxID=1053134 RepID=A0A8H4UKJ5_9HYPO|nr:hypothetical protein FZEAL_5420 [Fusarium zealandicum]